MYFGVEFENTKGFCVTGTECLLDLTFALDSLSDEESKCIQIPEDFNMDGAKLQGQVYGTLSGNPQWVKLSSISRALENVPQNKSDPNKVLMFFTEPVQTALKSGPQKLRYSFSLPTWLPPSYRGVGVRFLYHVSFTLTETVGFKEGSIKTVVVKAPFQVIAPYFSNGEMIDWTDHAGIVSLDSKFVSISDNPELMYQQKGLEVGLTDEDLMPIDMVESLPFSRAAAVFSRLSRGICTSFKEGGKNLLRLNMETIAFAPGSTVCGYLDFSSASRACHAVNARLLCVEVLSETISTNKTSSTTVSETTVMTGSGMLVPFTLTIPFDATQEFQTKEVRVFWALQFTLTLLHPKHATTVQVTNAETAMFHQQIHVLHPTFPSPPI